jgi:hypothetical protein
MKSVCVLGYITKAQCTLFHPHSTRERPPAACTALGPWKQQSPGWLLFAKHKRAYDQLADVFNHDTVLHVLKCMHANGNIER